MDQIIEQMLKQHDTQTEYDKKNAVKEVIQEIVLCGLSRAGFFKTAAFYGGTALRIFYGLDRFSEYLDFSLKSCFTTCRHYSPGKFTRSSAGHGKAGLRAETFTIMCSIFPEAQQ